MTNPRIAQNVKPDLNRHVLSLSIREYGEELWLECSCGWDTRLRSDDYDVTAILDLSNAHRRDPRAGQREVKKTVTKRKARRR